MDQAKLIETLRIPELKRGELPVELTPKALQEWREGLPLANLQETTRQVFTLLRDANRQQLPEKGRLLLLEALGPQIDYISGALSKGAQGHAHPLPDKVTKLVQLNQELLAEAAIAYKIIAKGLLGKRFMFGGGGQRQLVTALQAVLHYFGRIVLESYRTYVPFPEGLWGEIHATYALAELRKLEQHRRQLQAADARRAGLALQFRARHHRPALRAAVGVELGMPAPVAGRCALR
jgi:hypothetical protein